MSVNGPLLAIRADAGHQTGIGHVMRTLAIAQSWKARDGRVTYLSPSMPESLRSTLSDQGMEVLRIDAIRDAEATVEAMQRIKAQVLLVDHYGLSDTWWRTLPRTRRWKTAALNDFTTPIHTSADVLVSPRVKQLSNHAASGAAYLLIRDELQRTAVPEKTDLAHAARVLVVLGGADPRGVAPAVAKWLQAESKQIVIRVIEGPAAKNREQLETLATSDSHVEVVVAPASMRPHYEWADTVICSPSTTAFEALHHGLVTGLVLTADNQTEVASELLAEQVAVLIADARSEAFSSDRKVWAELALNGDARRKLSQSGAQMVDGKGAGRVCDLLGLPEIHLRGVTSTDTRLLFDWANDPVARAASFSSVPIVWEKHEAWVATRLAKHDPFWIAEDDEGIAMALIRFDFQTDASVIISYNLAPQRRGAGLSALILERACRRFRKDYPETIIHAWIKSDNEASLRCFTKAGFVEASSEQPDRRFFVQSP